MTKKKSEKVSNDKKFAVITTFPNADWYEYLHASTMSFLKYLPVEVPVLLKLYKNDMQKVVNESLENLIKEMKGPTEGRQVHIETGSTKEEDDFFSRHANYKNPGDYRTNYIDFSHKVFALYQAYLFAKKEGFEYLVWIDS